MGAPPFAPGLSTQEALRRLAADGPNVLPSGPRRDALRMVRDYAGQSMFLLLLAGGLLYLVLGEPREGLLLLSLVLVTLGIDIYQESKTERALRALRDMASPRAAVVRDGETVLLDSRELVRGDLCPLHEGDRVPADGVLLGAQDLQVDEALLTGESVAVEKSVDAAGPPGHEAAPTASAGDPEAAGLVFAGTTITRGHGFMRVTATGAASAIGRIGVVLHELEPDKSPLEVQVGRLVRLFGLAGGAASVMLAGWYVVTGGAVVDALLAGIALALSLLPEEFVVVLAVFPALGAWRLARAQVLTRRLSAIETLGAVSVLCVDKTGTLTENQMRVAALCAGEALVKVDEHTSELAERYHRLLEFAVLAAPGASPDPMDRALHRLAQQCLGSTEHLHPDWRPAAEYGLSRQLRAVSHAWLERDDAAATVAAKGAPEAIVDLCHLAPDAADTVLARATGMAAGGLRVLGVAAARFAGPPFPDHQHAFDFELVGLVGFADPLREGIAGVTAQCKAAGIRILMITGDYPATARQIALQAGIGPGGMITGDELENLSPDALRERLRGAAVCARIAPEQKLAIVQALRANGDIVGMTGDGVNDAPALRAADVGVAMGLRGTEVARQAASLVLLDDQFASVARAVRLGRQIFQNIRKAMIYVVAAHVPTAGLALLPLALGWPILLYPVHIVCLELLIAPTCSLAFESEAAEEDLMRLPPRDPRRPLLGPQELAYGFAQGVVALLAVLAVYGLALQTLPVLQARACAFAALVVADIGLIFSNRSMRQTSVEAMFTPNRIVWAVCAAAFAILALALYLPALAALFYFAPPPPWQLAAAGLAGFCPLVLTDLAKLARRLPWPQRPGAGA